MKKIISWISDHLCAAWLLLISVLAIAACGIAMGGMAETDASVLNVGAYSEINNVHTNEA